MKLLIASLLISAGMLLGFTFVALWFHRIDLILLSGLATAAIGGGGLWLYSECLD